MNNPLKPIINKIRNSKQQKNNDRIPWTEYKRKWLEENNIECN